MGRDVFGRSGRSQRHTWIEVMCTKGARRVRLYLVHGVGADVHVVRDAEAFSRNEQCLDGVSGEYRVKPDQVDDQLERRVCLQERFELLAFGHPVTHEVHEAARR